MKKDFFENYTFWKIVLLIFVTQSYERQRIVHLNNI